MEINQKQIKRPPIVVILGHIDHGKTTLLDNIRKSHVTKTESGGITQHIGAYQIEHKGEKITFIDTPGHEAFSAMRSRGAKVADIAILIIDAAEGIKEQTKEAIKHIKESNVKMIVTFNKIDKPNANPEKIKGDLLQEEIMVESMGGKIPSVSISAQTGEGVDELLEVISLLSDLENFTANMENPAEGVIIESLIDKQRGSTATLLLRNGALKEGDIVATPSTFGKIKRLEDFQGKNTTEIYASGVAIVPGAFGNVPKVGEIFKVFPNTELANKFIELEKKKESHKIEIEPGQKVVNLIIKTDVQGSLEAVEFILNNIPKDQIVLNIIKSEVGDVNESDVQLAKTGKSVILAFRVKSSPISQKIAEKEDIIIVSSDIIYNLIEKMRKLMSQMFEPEMVKVDLGKLEVLATFLSSKNRQIVGGKVIEGEIKKGSAIEVYRGEEKIGSGKMINLQRDKKDIDKVSSGNDCGILYEGNVKIEVGDILNIYTIEKRKIEL